MKECIKVNKEGMTIPLKILDMGTKATTMKHVSHVIKRHVISETLIDFGVSDVSELPEDLQTIIHKLENEVKIVDEVVKGTHKEINALTNHEVEFDMTEVDVFVPHHKICWLENMNKEA